MFIDTTCFMVNHMIQRVYIVFALIAMTALPAAAQERTRFAPDAEIRSAFNEVVLDTRASVVQIVVDGEERVLGTIIDEDGYVLSKASELKGEKIKVVLSTGRGFHAELKGVDRKNDLAMLKIDAKRLTAAPLAFDKPGLGRMVACVGLSRSPEAIGIISAKPREIKPAQLVLGVILRAHPDGLWVDSARDWS